VDAHHVRHWARGGETRLDNLVLLCRRHHRLFHEGAYSVELLAGEELRFRDPRGAPIANAPPLPASRLDRLPERRPFEIDAETYEAGAGDRMDRDLTVEALLVVQPPSARDPLPDRGDADCLVERS
jgi:hypothetical protein